jgi:hypothetical protein
VLFSVLGEDVYVLGLGTWKKLENGLSEDKKKNQKKDILITS